MVVLPLSPSVPGEGSGKGRAAPEKQEPSGEEKLSEVEKPSRLAFKPFGGKNETAPLNADGQTETEGGKGNHKVMITVVCAVVVAIMIAVLICCCCACKKRNTVDQAAYNDLAGSATQAQ